MKSSARTQGAAMLVVVLFTLLLLAGILAATLRLSLSSRQNTADQAATLKAQYAAESNIALVSSRLKDIQGLLSAGSFSVPTTTTADSLKTQAETLCGKTGSTAWQETTEFALKRSDSDPKPFPNAKLCVPNPSSLFAGERSGILADFVVTPAYAQLPSGEGPAPVTDRTARLNWWNSLLTPSDKQIGGAKFKLKLIKIAQLTPTNYRFYVRASDVRVIGEYGDAKRVLAGQSLSEGQWWFEIVLPSLLDDVLMTNHHRSKVSRYSYDPAGEPRVNFDDQVFDGSIHTNERFLFTSRSSAKFKGKVSSVGCVDLPMNGIAASGDCSKSPGVYISGNKKEPERWVRDKDKWIADTITSYPRTVEFVKTGNPPATDYSQTDFTADYKPLPLNENDQKAAASSGGLSLIDSSGNQIFDGVELVAAGSDGKALSEYKNYKWTEPSPVYQYIRLLKAGSVAAEYRYGPDKILYKKNNSTGQFVSEGRSFNGMIYGKNLANVKGPARKDGDKTNGELSNTPPALASFAGITLAASESVTIDTDLTLSETPCTFAATQANSPCTRRPANILGIYAQKGDVTISTKTGDDLNLHAAIMSSEGEVVAQNYDTRGNQGNVKLIGSLIENWYGAFGLTDGTGYGREFTYDQRLREGITPPFFPVSPRWQAEDASLSSLGMTNLTFKQAKASDY